MSHRVITLTLFLVTIQAVTGPANDQAPETASKLRRFEFTRFQLGTSIRLAFYTHDEAIANRAASAAFDRVEQLNSILSDYLADSELNLLCVQSRPGHPVRVSHELFHVLRESVVISELTGGAFDVTVGPLTRLWREARREGRLPAPGDVERARRLVGYQHLRLDAEDRSVEFQIPGMRIDLGGIAKGYIADQALQRLREHGAHQALVDAGGDIVIGAPPPDADGWYIGIAPLEADEADPTRLLQLKNTAIATSGDGVKYIEVDGVRHSHIIRPATGESLTSPSSVTVIAPTGLQADALASALSILDPDQGIELIDRQDRSAALIVWSDGTEVHRRSSRVWEGLVAR